MLAAIRDGLRLWGNNMPLLSALVLTFWLPGNILLDYFVANSTDETEILFQFQFPSLFEGVFGPIYIAAIIYVLDCRRRGQRVGYVEAMKRGFRLWGNLFATRFVAGFIMVLCFFLLVIPGLVCAVKYVFLEMAVVLEGKHGVHARTRTWDLTSGHAMTIFATCSLYYLVWICLIGVLTIPLEILNESIELSTLQYYSIDVVISCIGDVFLVPLTAILYCMYLHTSGQDTETSNQNAPHADSFERLPPLRGPIGDNPYEPPQTF